MKYEFYKADMENQLIREQVFDVLFNYVKRADGIYTESDCATVRDEICLQIDQSQFTADEAEEHINQEVERRIAERMPSGPKRLFQILDEMNLDDTKYGTRLVSISNSLISADKVKAGTKVAMGADDQVLIDIMSDKCALLLLVIDRKEYESRSRLVSGQKTEGGGK